MPLLPATDCVGAFGGWERAANILSPTEAGKLLIRYERMGYVSCSWDYTYFLVSPHSPPEVLVDLKEIIEVAGMEIVPEYDHVGLGILREEL